MRRELDWPGPRARRWECAAFWDEVEREIEAADPFDFSEFLLADELPPEPRAGFREELRESLLDLFRRRHLA